MVSANKSAGDGEVASCVSNLIDAFTDGLNVFKRLRERRRKRKSKHKDRGARDESVARSPEAEMQLSDSLKRGPLELREKYESCYGEKGDVFAKGDAVAHASLAETLIRFNTGLVRIIAAFLDQTTKRSDLKLDYKSLTSLSDASRREAIDSLNQLHQRLSRAQLQLLRKPRSESRTEPGEKKKQRSSSRARSQGPTVTRVSGTSGQTQLGWVRPRTTRRGSVSTSSSGWSSNGWSSKSSKMPPSTRTSSADMSPPRSPPLPEYSAVDPLTPPKAPAIKRPASTQPRPSHNTAWSTAWPQPTPFPSHIPERYVAMPVHPPAPSSPPLPSPNSNPLPFSNAHTTRRRAQKPTPTMYTFASDSTKLGEIPQRNWTVPFDYTEAERLNIEAAVRGRPVEKAPVEQKTKTRKGFRSMFKK